MFNIYLYKLHAATTWLRTTRVATTRRFGRRRRPYSHPNLPHFSRNYSRASEYRFKRRTRVIIGSADRQKIKIIYRSKLKVALVYHACVYLTVKNKLTSIGRLCYHVN